MEIFLQTIFIHSDLLTFVNWNLPSSSSPSRTDFTGATWCYVDKFDHTCQDAFNSDRYPNLKVSYEACTTPRCRGNRPFNNNGFNNNGFNNGGFNNGGGLLGILGGGGGGGGTEVIISGAGGGFNNNGRRPNRNRNRPNRNRNRNRNRDRNRGDVILIDARDNQDDQSGDAITFSQ